MEWPRRETSSSLTSQFIILRRNVIVLSNILALKRRIDIVSIRGISLSKVTDEFVLHGDDLEYDYNYITSRRKKIVEILSKCYFELRAQELKLFESELKTLKTLVTTKKEKKKDQNFSRIPSTNQISLSAFLYGVKQDNPSLGKKTGTQTGTIYSKFNDNTLVKLGDFKVIKVLGRGTFGKVCMVEHTRTKEIYAMKTLKKDVLIDQRQIENTLLEKKILETIEHQFLIALNYCFQTEERIYFIMPFIRGGELFQHLRKFKIFNEDK